MERLNLKFETVQKAFQTLKEILNEPYSILIRDATIQRFEYTYEALWKFLCAYLKEEGIVENTPKGVFREIMRTKLITEDETEKFLKMVDDRNASVHIYKEEMAKELYDKIKDHASLIEQLLNTIKNKL